MININPSLRQFVKLSKNHNLIVLSHKFYSDWLTPLSIYYGLSRSIKGDSFLLESVEGEEKICRFSFLGFKPLCVFKSKDRKIHIEGCEAKSFETKKDPLYELKKVMAHFKVAPRENLRFFGGFVGYLGYDLIRFYEPVGRLPEDSLNTFDTYLVLPKFLIIFDHLKRQIEILSFVIVENNKNLKRIYSKEKKITEDVFKRIITIPLHPRITDREFDHIVDTIAAYKDSG